MDEECVMNRFQLIQWKAAIKLESKGMKHSSGRSVKAFAARQFGMPVSSTHAEVIDKIEQVLEDSIPHADDRVNQANGNCPWEQPS
jgi:hypothetical protein